METVNKSGKGRRGKRKIRKALHSAPTDTQVRFPAVGRPEELVDSEKSEGLSALHGACLRGQLANLRLLSESMPGRINSRDQQGRGPLHMVLSSRSAPNTSACLRYLVEHGADVNAKTDSGATPLHLASSEGLLDCTEILVQAGADVLARDDMGHTPLELARVWCHRKVARYLKSCLWREEKRKEMQERKLLQALYGDLVDTAKRNDRSEKTLADVKVAEWANSKGFPPPKDSFPRASVSQYHIKCLNMPHPAEQPLQHQPGGPQGDRDNATRRPLTSSSRPWTIFMGLQSEEHPGVPDLRDCVTVRRGGGGRQLRYTTKWDSTPRPAPDLPLDTLERVLFPRAFPSRIASSRHFEPQDIVEVRHRGHPQGQSTSPWTEVAMHLPEVLEPGHY